MRPTVRDGARPFLSPAVPDGVLPTRVSSVLLCAAGLACLFGGIWTTDAIALTALQVPGNDLGMRILSLLIYVFVLLMVCHKGRHFRHPAAGASRDRRNIFRAIVFVTVLYLCGGIVVLMVLQTNVALPEPLPLVVLASLKCIGAPISIILVCAYARLPSNQIARASLLGIAGAFVLHGCLGLLRDAKMLSWMPEISFLVGSALILASSLLAVLLSSRLGEGAFGRVWQNASSQDGPPIRDIVGRNIAASIVVVSMILGFLRAGMPARDADLRLALVVALALMMLLALTVAHLDLHGLFRGALICTAAGFLLGPLVSLVAGNVPTLLVLLGGALFEVVAWVVPVIVARSCPKPLVGAAAARLAVVAGHLLGALLASGALLVTQSHPEAMQAASLVIVFVYILMLVYLFNDPTAVLPFMAGRDDGSIPASWSLRDRFGWTRQDLSGSAAASTSPSGEAAFGNFDIRNRRDRRRNQEGASGPACADASGLQGACDPCDASGQEGACPASEKLETADARQDGVGPLDYEVLLWKKPCAIIAGCYRLTPRETDVLEQLAQGRDLAFIEERLVVSRNTVKMHIRHLYEKLGVHSKQEVIDLVESERRRIQGTDVAR